MAEHPLFTYIHSKEGQIRARAYLSSAKPLEALIALHHARMDRLRQQAAGLTRALDAMPGRGGHSDRVGNAAAELADLEEQIVRDYHLLMERQSELTHVVRNIPDDRERAVLEMRYLHGLSMLGIAHRLGYEVRQIQRIHHQGLARVAGWIYQGVIQVPPDAAPVEKRTADGEEAK